MTKNDKIVADTQWALAKVEQLYKQGIMKEEMYIKTYVYLVKTLEKKVPISEW